MGVNRLNNERYTKLEGLTKGINSDKRNKKAISELIKKRNLSKKLRFFILSTLFKKKFFFLII